MCGIFGIILKNKKRYQSETVASTIDYLFKLSMLRGKDAAGVFFETEKQSILVKKGGHPEDFLRSDEYTAALKNVVEGNGDYLMALGQCRLVMSGSAAQENSNQPIQTPNIIGLHNGILTKVGGESLNRMTGVHLDSDSIALFDEITKARETGASPQESLKNSLEGSEGSYSVSCYFPADQKLLLTSNTGSLFLYEDEEVYLFASEPAFLEKVFANLTSKKIDKSKITQVKDSIFEKEVSVRSNFHDIQFLPKRRKEYKRCTRCILPENYPFIAFDKDGVCNFCQTYEKQKLYGEEKLLQALDKCRSRDGSPDCLVGLSGGRDSSYGMYLLKKKYGMNPIAYTFDWGLTTDVSRRNQARVCGKLGIEHIIRSPDIIERRRHIRKNVDAFLERPHLGMVPLFMAGDKDFFHLGRTIRKERNLPLTVHCTGHEIERQHFKTGFCGVDDNKLHNVRLYNFSLLNKVKLAFFYTSQYVLNPAYLNESFYYSVRSFFYSFFGKDDFIYLFEYVEWKETEVERVIKEELGWESDVQYGKNQWRMGDGQTAFINYIYYTVAGFSEFDNLRANQVRAGVLTRDEALKLAEQDNMPKWESLQSFASVVGFNLDNVIVKINNIPKL
jgi:glucosamine--fructose-6-phosphate aminotransferase (isomerizing)